MASLQRIESRRDLAQFVRECRDRIKPQDVGLAPGTRRRTPGLRREEVAQLVGVSVTWYTWFEQGRDIQVSTDFLDRVCSAFRLDSGERTTLFELAQHGPPPAPMPARPLALVRPTLVTSRDLNLDGRSTAPVATRPRQTLVPVRTAPDPEAARIDAAIRNVIAGEGRLPPPVTAPPPAAVGPQRRVRWGIGVTLLSVLMLVPY